MNSVRRLIDRLLAEPDPQVRLLLILRVMTDKWLMNSHGARVFGSIMANDSLPREQKTLLCELCMEERFPFVLALKRMGFFPAERSPRRLGSEWMDYLMEHLSKDIEPLMRAGSFSMRMFPIEFLRAPLAWSVCLGMMTPVQAIDWCLKGLKQAAVERGAHSARAFAEAAVDVLLNWRSEFTPEHRMDILETLRQVHDIHARMAAYRAGTILVAKDYARPGLDDRANAVRKRRQLYVEKGASDKPLPCMEDVQPGHG